MGALGQIPWTACYQYAQSQGVLEDEVAWADLQFCISAMDEAFLRYHNENAKQARERNRKEQQAKAAHRRR